MSHILCNASLKSLNKFKLDEFLNEAIELDKPYDLVLIFPTGKFVRYFKQKFIGKYFSKHKKPLSNLKIFTLQNFIQTFFDSLIPNDKFKLLSDGYRLAIFEEAIKNANLKFYTTKSRKLPNSVLIRLFSLINGLREDGISLDKLQSDYNNIIDSQTKNQNYYTNTNRLADIIKIYESYEKSLGTKFIDFPKLLDITIANLKDLNDSSNISVSSDSNNSTNINHNNSFQKIIDRILGEESIIYLDGFTDFKQPEIEFLSLFVNISNPFGIHIDYVLNPGKQNGNGPLFGNLENIIIQLHSAGFHLLSLSQYPNETIDSEDDIINNSQGKEIFFKDSVEFLRRWLFNTEKDLKNPNFSRFIKILVAETRKDEAKYIAKLIRNLIINKGYLPEEICVCSRKPELYSNLFREIFSRYRIPANITDRFNLSQSQLVNSILSVLNVVIGGYKIEDVEKSLLSPFLSFDFENKESGQINRTNLINIARLNRIRGGYLFGAEKEWVLKLKNSISILKNSLELSSKESDDSFELHRLRNRIDNTIKAHNDFQHFLKLLNFKKKNITAFEFRNIILDEMIKKLKVIENIEKHYSDILSECNNLDDFSKIELIEQCENDSRALSKFIEILDEMVYVINEIYPNLQISLDFYLERLKTAISNTKYQIREKQGFGVTVTSIEQTRGIPFKVMILCGAIDGEFILKYTPNLFLGLELPHSEKRHIHSERMLFYQFLTNSPDLIANHQKEIYITYFKNDENGEKVRSTFIDALLKITKLLEDGCIYDLSNKSITSSSENSDYNDLSDSLNSLELSISNYDELYYSVSNNFKQNNLIQLSNFPEIVENNIKYLKRYLFPSINEKSELTIDEESSIEHTSIKDNIDEKVFSITELETYAACPFKYFVKYFLNIEEPAKIDFSFSPLEVGSLLHIVLYQFYTELQKIETLSSEQESEHKELISCLQSISKNLKPVILTPDKKDFYLSILINITENELKKIRFEHPYLDLEIENILGIPNVRPGVLSMWLNSELNKQNNNWFFIPSIFEMSFGLPSNYDYKFGYVDFDGKFNLKGKIDRIEFAFINDKPYFIIADYKSNLNNISNHSEIKKGISYQMPLYLVAAKKVFEKYQSDISPFGATYYSLKPRVNNGKLEYFRCLLIPPSNPIKKLLGKSHAQFLKSDDELNEILQISIERAKGIVDNISALNFPVEPLNTSVCRNCNYISSCRIKENTIIFDTADFNEE